MYIITYPTGGLRIQQDNSDMDILLPWTDMRDISALPPLTTKEVSIAGSDPLLGTPVYTTTYQWFVRINLANWPSPWQDIQLGDTDQAGWTNDEAGQTQAISDITSHIPTGGGGGGVSSFSAGSTGYGVSNPTTTPTLTGPALTTLHDTDTVTLATTDYTFYLADGSAQVTDPSTMPVGKIVVFKCGISATALTFAPDGNCDGQSSLVLGPGVSATVQSLGSNSGNWIIIGN